MFGAIGFNQQDIVKDGLVLWMDANDRTSYPGTGSIWRDLSRSYITGSLTNGPTYNSSNGGSIVFDGSNDYVNCGNTGSLGLGTMTIGTWVKPSTDVGDYRMIIADESYGGGSWNYRLYLNQYNGKLTFDMQGGGYGGVTSTNSIANNNWQYICGVRTSVGGTLNLYINGVLNSTAADGSSISSLTNQVWIGISPYLNGSYPYTGNISIMQIYNRALSQQEILQNYNANRNRFGF